MRRLDASLEPVTVRETLDPPGFGTPQVGTIAGIRVAPSPACKPPGGLGEASLGRDACRGRASHSTPGAGSPHDADSNIAREHGLAEPDLDRLASPWHTDGDLGRPIEVVTDMSKSRKLGFTADQSTDDPFFGLFVALRNDRLIP